MAGPGPLPAYLGLASQEGPSCVTLINRPGSVRHHNTDSHQGNLQPPWGASHLALASGTSISRTDLGGMQASAVGE